MTNVPPLMAFKTTHLVRFRSYWKTILVHGSGLYDVSHCKTGTVTADRR